MGHQIQARRLNLVNINKKKSKSRKISQPKTGVYEADTCHGTILKSIAKRLKPQQIGTTMKH